MFLPVESVPQIPPNPSVHLLSPVGHHPDWLSSHYASETSILQSTSFCHRFGDRNAGHKACKTLLCNAPLLSFQGRLVHLVQDSLIFQHAQGPTHHRNDAPSLPNLVSTKDDSDVLPQPSGSKAFFQAYHIVSSLKMALLRLEKHSVVFHKDMSL